MRFQAWMIFLIGLAVAFGISQFIEDRTLAGSLIGEYILYGGIILAAYYIGYRLWFEKKTKA